MELINNLGYLRKATALDANTLANWWADGNVMEHAGFPNGIKTDLDALKTQLKNQTANKTIWILEDAFHQPIGEMAHRIKESTATIGIKICETQARGKGIGRAALKCLIGYLFETLKVDHIWLDTMIENERAQHVYASLKFQKININKDVWTDQLGNLRTSVEYSLTKSSYQKNRAFYRKP